MGPDQSYLAKLDRNLDRATRLLEQQQVRVQTIAESGLVSKHSLDLLDNMKRSVELLHWQRALLLWRTKDPSIKLRTLQPSPTLAAPDTVLQEICTALTTLEHSGLAPNELVDAAVKQAVGR
ncbi:hypothetical protein BH09PSE5_BH09PSE5_15820 [soil metagenome]